MGYEFNSEEQDQSVLGSFDALPAGRYPATVDSAELGPTSNGTGMKFAVCYSVAKGDFEGRKIFVNYNVENQSEKARNIGRAQLAAALTALGHPKLDLENPELIFDKLVYLQLGQRKNKASGELENNVKKYQSLAEVRAQSNGSVKSTPTVQQPVTRASDLAGDDDNIPF